MVRRNRCGCHGLCLLRISNPLVAKDSGFRGRRAIPFLRRVQLVTLRPREAEWIGRFLETNREGASFTAMNFYSNDAGPSPVENVQTLFIQHESIIRAFILGLLPSLNDADDILQETFVTVSKKADSYEAGTNFVAWACAIARFKVLESYRMRTRVNALSAAALLALAADAPPAEITRSREAALVRCIEKLAPKSRELLWRRYARRENSDDMASGLGITSIAVRVALSKIRAFLRDCVTIEIQNAA